MNRQTELVKLPALIYESLHLDVLPLHQDYC
jgi:hypothetical protein